MVVGTVSVTGTNPILAFSGPGAICVERITVTGSTFRWNLRAQSNRPIGLQWWVFDTAAASIKDASMADLEAAFYDQYGVKTFDAAASVMRIVDGIATPKTPSDVPFGGWNDLSDTTDFGVPAGKVYAIVQSTPAFVMTTYDTGSYGSGQYPPELNIGDGEPPLGMTWRYQNLESYQSTGGFINASTIRVGLTRFEFWPGWNSRDSTPFINVEGQARHLIVDMTNFLAAGAPNPSVVVGSVTATSRSVTTGGSAVIASSTTPSVTASATGGASPYAFLWQYVRGDIAVSANGSTTTASFSTKTLNQDHNTTREAVWRCRITDQNGVVGYSPEVTFKHVASNYALDVVPDPVSFTNITINSNDPDVAWVGTVQTITGINQPITLRVERYSYSGNLDGAMVDVVVKDAAGVQQFHQYFDARGTGMAYLDVTVQNGWSVGYYAHGVTNSGRKSATWNMVVWNLSNPGGSAQISSKSVSVVVDADDNFNNADYVPNALNWSNISGSTNDASFYLANPELTVTGINQPIVIRATISNVVKTGNIVSNSRLDFQRDGAYVHDTSGIGNGYWTEATVTNGQRVRFIAHCGTSAGTGTLSYTVTLTNRSAGSSVLDTFTVNQTVDADNNHNVAPTPDYTPNSISLSNQSVVTNEWEGYTPGTFFQIVGINQPITIRITRGTTTDSENIFTRRLVIGKSTNGGVSYVETNMGALSAPLDFTANNGDWFFLKGYFSTNSGRGSASWPVTVSNATMGQTMGSITVSGTVDNDNNYNVPTSGSVSPRNWEDIHWSYSSTNGSSSQPNYRLGPAQTIAGLASGQTATISLTATADGSAMAFAEIYKNGISQGTKLYSPEGSTSVQTYPAVTVQNGDTIAFRCGVGGRLAEQWEGMVYQEKTLNVSVHASAGGLIDTFNFYGGYSDTYSRGGGGGGPIEMN